MLPDEPAAPPFLVRTAMYREQRRTIPRPPSPPAFPTLERTGVQGFDQILDGGLPRGRMFLVEGSPGTGKTTFALHFARQGVAEDQRVLYVSLSQTDDELRQIAASHGWDLEGIELFGLNASDLAAEADREQTLFRSADVDLSEVMETIRARVREIDPERVVFDSAAEIRLLAGDPLRTRRQFLGLREFFSARGITVLMLDDESGRRAESAIHSIMHGVIRLEQHAPDYGQLYRRLRVMKLRGKPHPTGYHDFRVHTGGLEVYSSLRAPALESEEAPALLRTGEPSIDALLGGGLDYGASVLLLGVAGTGKSSLASLYAIAAAEAGHRAAIYTFDERLETLLLRSDSLGLPVRAHVEAGRLLVSEMSPSRISSGELTAAVRYDVEHLDVRVVIIDSLTGYLSTVPPDRRAATQLHDLLVYLGSRGVLSLIPVPQHGLFGPDVDSQLDVSYLADTVLLLRHFEAQGELCKAISVVKRRHGSHDNSIRIFHMSDDGLRVGDSVNNYQGVLTGIPAIGGRGPARSSAGDGQDDEARTPE